MKSLVRLQLVLICAAFVSPATVLRSQVIDLGDVTAEGNGKGTAPANNTGIDPRNGSFVQGYWNGTLLPGETNPSPVPGSGYIDSVFIIGPADSGDVGAASYFQPITQSGVIYEFPSGDAPGTGWNYILRNRNGGVSEPPIRTGGLDDLTNSAVGIHAAIGITYNLDLFRFAFGADQVGCFSTFWGLDSCIDGFGVGGDANLYVIFSSDGGGAFLSQTRRFTRDQGEFLQIEIPPDARYLTLATGSNGPDTCDHGTFAHAVITTSPCPLPSFTDIFSVDPPLASSLGGTVVHINGRGFSPEHDVTIGGLPLEDQQLLGDTIIRGVVPALPPGFHTVEYRQQFGGVEARLVDSLETAPPPALESVTPHDVYPNGLSFLEIRGANFRRETFVEIGIYPLVGPILVSDSLITGGAPVLQEGDPLGSRQVLVADSRGYSLLDDGVEYIPIPLRPVLTSVTPRRVSSLGITRVAVEGANFTPSTSIRMAGAYLLSPETISPSRIEGIAPPLEEDEGEPRQPGPYSVFAYSEGGNTFLPDGVVYVLPPVVTAVTPAEVSTRGTTRVTVEGRDFTEATRIRFAGVELLSAQVESPTRITGIAPPLPAGEGPGAKDVTAEDDIAATTLAGGVVYAAPLVTLTRVEPAVVTSEGGVSMVFFGDGLEGLKPRIGGFHLLEVTYREGQGAEGNTLSGITPALPLGRLTADLADAQGTVLASLAEAVEVVESIPPDAIPLLGPNQIEASLAEGKARFLWNNPVPAQEILVTDIGGSVLKRLLGETRSLELAVDPGADSFPLRFVSVFGADRVSKVVDAIALRLPCSVPTPLMGVDTAGAQDLTIYGGSLDTPPLRCAGAPGGGEVPGGGGLFDFAVPDLKNLEILAVREPGPKFGSVISDSSRDRLYAIDPRVFERYTRHIFTGFTLEKDSDQLQIDGWYAMPVHAVGLKLKGRLIHVFPDDGFVDEFTFPVVLQGISKHQNSVVYYRADSDVSETGAQSCGLKIPAGDYVLELMAVEGDLDTPHFVFQNDGRNEEILIKGVPCPPYPRVRVTDYTGKRTLPDVREVSGRSIGSAPGGGLFVEFRVDEGTWRDETGTTHQVAQDPGPFEYSWNVYGTPTGVQKSETGKSSAIVALPRLGCYEVVLTVSEPGCNRRVRRTFEVPVFPQAAACTSPFYSILSPSPDPGSLKAIAGLKGPIQAGRGTAPGHTRGFRVFVLPKGCCNQNGSLNNNCPAPKPADLRFRLGVSNGSDPSTYPSIYTVPPEKVLDLCDDFTRDEGARYFLVPVDFDRTDLIPGGDSITPRDVYLQAHVVTYRDPGARNVDGQNGWQNVGGPIRMVNRPESLAKNYFAASYQRADGTYHFQLQSTRGPVQNFPVPPSKEVPLLSQIFPTKIPSFPSDVNTGLNTGMALIGGKWEPERALGNLAGKVLGNQLDGAPIDVIPDEVKDFVDNDLTWEWSDRRTLFEHHFQQKLFESILWTGVIVVVPVTVWGSLGIGFDFEIRSEANVKVAPFAAVLGGHTFESKLGVTSKFGVSIPAELRTDILFGVVSQSFSTIVGGSSNFGVGLEALDDKVNPKLDLSVRLSINLLGKICLFWYLCYPQFFIPLLPDTPLIEQHLSGGGGEAPAPLDPPDLAGPRGGELTIWKLSEELTSPAVAVAPSGNRTFNIYFSSPRQSFIADLYDLQSDGSVKPTTILLRTPELQQAGVAQISASFLTESRVLVASTFTYPEESSAPYPLPADRLPTRDELNELKAQDEVILNFIEPDPLWGWAGLRSIRLSDPSDEVTAPDRRVDGRPAISASPPQQDALVAWVRFLDREYLVEEPGTTTVFHKEGQAALSEQQVPTVRPALERSAIYTRRVNFQGLIDAPRVISPAGINLEPTIAFSPTGNEAYCVWVHDPVHKDLIGSNLGRNFLYSIWTRATDSWSAPQAVLASGDDFPGALEPWIGLKADGKGLLAFNALDKGAIERDSGLTGSNRFVFTCRLDNGVFGAPVKIHGLCGKRVLGRYQTVTLPPLYQIDPRDLLFKRPPEWVMIFQETGPVGRAESAGNVLVAPLAENAQEFAAPVTLTQDGRTHTNVVGTVWNGGLQSLNLKGPFAKFGAAGGGIVGDEGYELLAASLDPDLALAGCRLSDQFPGAGAFVKARIEVENRGLAGSALTPEGESLSSVRIAYLGIDGSETVEAEEVLEELAPGERTVVEFQLEMPLDPVKLVAQVVAGPDAIPGVDRDPTNNRIECFFGSPQPSDFACRTIFVDADETALAERLDWTNPAIYDDICLFRDGTQIACLPGGSTSFVDDYAAPGPHVYEVRGRIGASVSSRGKLECVVEPPPPPGGFRRGDADGSGSVDITDPINLLNYLFLAGERPSCADAADADDSGDHDITDAISLLGYLFTGGAVPPQPGPAVCGADPTEDGLARCAGECR